MFAREAPPLYAHCCPSNANVAVICDFRFSNTNGNFAPIFIWPVVSAKADVSDRHGTGKGAFPA